jgi:type III secretion system low calcium response chaperone LcrH/SycD
MLLRKYWNSSSMHSEPAQPEANLFFEKGLLPSLAEVLRLIEEGEVAQRALGLADEWMHEQYRHGYDFFCQAKYTEAMAVFAHLTALNPTVKAYWLGLAVAQIRAKFWEMALTSLAMATVVDPLDPRPHYYAGCCNLNLGRPRIARDYFELVTRLVDDQSEHQTMGQEAQEWVDRIRDNDAESR